MTKDLSTDNKSTPKGALNNTGKLGQLSWLWLSILVIILDLGSKAWVSAEFTYAQVLPVWPVFSFTLLHNTGAAFSFLADASGWQRWFFTIIAIVISTVLLVWLKRLKPHETWLACALALVLGGALGNLYDRVVLGYVVDFLLFHWENSYFPAFNIADSAITLGGIMLAWDMVRNPEGKTASQSDLNDSK
ncbi:signal peptidase II [Oceanospirillum multiglobuliferum]|uniref:signal peptidase II n=1 Tax=Oceanospirillum multiglobuliferum TaxID=64969 RepID=UPI0009D4EFAB|nr:signal peptidase II [Oceanospirillum multiglobuliferum]